MVKNQTCLLLLLVIFPRLAGMDDSEEQKPKHHTKSRSGSNEFVTINILPAQVPKVEPKDEKNSTEDRKNKLGIAAIAAASAICASGITAAVTLTIHYTNCKQ